PPASRGQALPQQALDSGTDLVLLRVHRADANTKSLGGLLRVEPLVKVQLDELPIARRQLVDQRREDASALARAADLERIGRAAVRDGVEGRRLLAAPAQRGLTPPEPQEVERGMT